MSKLEPPVQQSLARVWNLILRILRTLAVPALVVAAVLLAWQALNGVSLPFPPFETTGAIYVESPQVYTRERLVNDRYSQDYWLKNQLASLDTAKNLLVGVTSSKSRISGAMGPGSTTLTEPKADPAAGLEQRITDLSFDQELRIRAGIRDAIRQLILENMLDDRHDLRGNTIYGLKFDTTVVPGTNTNKRAYVRVTLSIPPLIAGVDPSANIDFERLFLDTNMRSIQTNKKDTLNRAYELYKRWFKNVEFRLNTYLTKYFTSEARSLACACGSQTVAAMVDRCQGAAEERLDRITDAALDAVLSLNEVKSKSAVASNASLDDELDLPRPWSDYLQINRVRDDICGRRFHFVVAELSDTVYLSASSSESVFGDGASQYFRAGKTQDGRDYGFYNRFYTGTTDSGYLSQAQFDKINFHYPITSELISHVSARKEKMLSCSELLASGTCANTLEVIWIPSGFFNFVGSIINTDAYSYALFPKADSYGMLIDSATGAGISGRVSQANVVALDLDERSRKAVAMSRFIGFGDGQFSSNSQIAFGWIFADPDSTDPVQASQLSLVSVPAWTDDLRVTVATGWLDRNSNPEVTSSFEMSVPLPTDYEAFDAFVGSGEGSNQLRRRPKILEAFIGKSSVEACKSAKILIPGFRLWRSAVVTLGAQQADQITVLPNMQGIVAEFKKVDVPTIQHQTADQNSSRTANLKLRVWTSEGMAGGDSQSEVTVLVPAPLPQDCYNAPAAPPEPAATTTATTVQ